VDPSKRLPTVLLAAGAVVLLLAILLGERIGDRGLGEITQNQLDPVRTTFTPEPGATSGPFGPDWKRSETLSSAPDPRFPDPRVPPQPLPTRPPAPVETPQVDVFTPNPNLPIWRQKPFATLPPSAAPSDAPTETPPAASPSPSPAA
jgi:hypothetical protein